MSQMGPWEYVIDFFKRLVKSRVDSAEIGARSKVSNAQYRAKSAVANRFNNAVDGAIDRGKQSFSRSEPETSDEPNAERSES